MEPVTFTAARLPLPTLLSQVLMAFTIEFDNEFFSGPRITKPQNLCGQQEFGIPWAAGRSWNQRSSAFIGGQSFWLR
jgi:hypothetical protein